MFYDISVQTRKCSALIQVSLPDVGWWWECKARAVLLGTANLCPICQNRCGCTPPCINEEENTPRTPSCGLGRHPTVQAAFLLHLCSWTCFVLQPLYVRWGFWHFWKHQSCSSWLGSYGNTSLGFFFFAAHEAVVQDTMILVRDPVSLSQWLFPCTGMRCLHGTEHVGTWTETLA